ncbi:MAG: GxxExxY protein [Nitrospinae bacterium]|nr:GxxExxY protein [Nitrospinota bacterium]
MGLIYEELTEKIIQAFYKVYNVLGTGYLESIYQNALVIELEDIGLGYETEKLVEIFYRNKKVGEHRLDLVIEHKVIVEIKAVAEFHPAHQAQVISYLKATGSKVGLLVNFGKDKVEYKRLVL